MSRFLPDDWNAAMRDDLLQSTKSAIEFAERHGDVLNELPDLYRLRNELEPDRSPD